MKYMNVGSAQHEAAEEPVVLLLVEEEWVEEAESHLSQIRGYLQLLRFSQKKDKTVTEN